jgi:DNA-binding NarL/FixJ family response regulator
MCLSEPTIRNMKVKLYDKLGVSNITQACFSAMATKLLFRPLKETTDKEPRRLDENVIFNTVGKITPEMYERIQDYLDIGMSVNAIAHKVHITEGAIRYAVKRGKLTVPFKRR